MAGSDSVTHIQTMEKIQDAVELLTTTANKVALAEDNLASHNTSEYAHEDIRDAIKDINTEIEDRYNKDEIDAKLTQHDTSITSHQDLRGRISQLEVEMATVASDDNLAEAIEAHNTSGLAHTDIRQSVHDLSVVVSEMAQSDEIANLIDSKLNEHDSSNTAHGSLNNRIEVIEDLLNDKADATTVAAQIEEHNYSPDSHIVIQDKIVQAKNDLIDTIVLEIMEHDENVGAHPYLRSVVGGLDNDLVVVRNNKPYIEQLAGLFGSGSGFSLASLQARIGVVEEGQNILSGEVAAANEDINEIKIEQIVQNDRISNNASDIAGLKVEVGNIKIRLGDIETRLGTTIVGDLSLNGFGHTVPLLVKRGNTYNVKFFGITPPVGESVTYELENVSSDLVFSKVTGIAQDEVITLDVDSDSEYASILNFRLKVNCSSGAYANIPLSTKVASPPDMSGVIISGIPNPAGSGKIYNFSFTPAVDVDGNPISYSTTGVSDGSSCTVSSTNRIGALNVSATAAPGETVSFTLVATTDYYSSTKVFVYEVALIPDVDNLIVNNLPNYVVPGDTYAMSFTGAISAVGGAIKYSVASKSGSVVTFSPNTNISEGAALTMVVPSNAPRGSVQTFIITATDPLGVSTVKEFTTKVNRLSIATDIIINNLSARLKPTTTYSVNVSGATDADTDQTLQYAISCSDANVSFSKSSGLIAGEAFDIIVGSGVTRGSTITFVVSVSDGLETVSKTIAVTVNNLPSVALNVNNIPTIAKPNSTHALSLSSTDLDTNQTLSYSVSSDKGYVTFSKSSAIAINESFNVIVSAAATRGETVTLTFSITDGLEVVTVIKTFKINTLPASAAAGCTLPTYIKPNSTNNCYLGGASDIDGQVLKYSISCDKEYVTFTKNTDLAAGETFDVILSSAAVRGDIISFTMTVFDGLETSSKVFTRTVNTLPVVTNLVASLAAIIKPSSTNPCVLSGATDIDSQTLTCSIVANKSYISFSKSTGITLGESFNIIASAAAVRGEVVTFTVTVSDGVETVTRSFTTKINILPVATSVAINNLATIIKPSSTNPCSITGASDTDGQDLYYTIVSNKSYITFSKSVGLVGGESFNIVASAAATRGETVTLTVTVSDGLETVTKTFTTIINSLPIATNVVCNLPASFNGAETKNFTISGATDVNSGQTLVYEIVYNGTGLTFSKVANITAGESLSVTGVKVSVDTTYTFTIRVKDSLGEYSATNKTVSVTILKILKAKAPQVTYPAAGQILPSDVFTVVIEEYSEYVDLS